MPENQASLFALNPPKAFLFDVFGTLVEWRETVAKNLQTCAKEALSRPSPSPSLAASTHDAVSTTSWHSFTNDWRAAYYAFTASYQDREPARDPSTIETIDQLHLSSLHFLIQNYGLAGLWTELEIAEMSLVWHRLPPHADSAPGLHALSQVYTTATLSNGNHSLLADLAIHGNLAFTHLFSAAQFGTYKPHPAAYDGAVQASGFKADEVVMVAGHLGDLEAARNRGLRTVYVEREGEEGWDAERVDRAREEGWVDMWIGKSERENGGGVLEVCGKAWEERRK